MEKVGIHVSFIHLMEYGRMESLSVMERLIILQELLKKDFIKMVILDMGKGKIFMKMVSLILEILKNNRNMALELIILRMVSIIKDNGRIICSMEKGWNVL